MDETGESLDISIHAPLRERHFMVTFNGYMVMISIHAPLRERPRLMIGLYDVCIFQSTLPCGSDLIQ